MGNETQKSDHVFVLAREASLKPFKAKIGDVELTIPHVASMDQFAVAEHYGREDQTDLEFLIGYFKIAMGEDVKILRDLHLSRPELVTLYKAHLAWGGTSEGESSASSD